MGIDSKAMLVSLTIHQWGGRKFDKKVTAEVETTHNAKDSGRFNKQLAAKQYTEALTSHLGRVRAYHYERTSPWGNEGQRILNAQLFMEYSDEIRKFRSALGPLKHSFVQNYPAMIQDAKVRLNGMFDPNDYPSANDAADAYDIEVQFSPVPTAGDFRVELNKDDVDAIRRELEARNHALLQNATHDCYDRLRTVLETMHLRLSDPKAVFRDSLVYNVMDAVDLLPKMNIAKDELLDLLCANARSSVCQYLPNELRKNKHMRVTCANLAKNLIDQIPR